MTAENKLCPKPNIPITNKTFSYKIIDVYNRIDRKLTLMKNTIKLKKCLTKYTQNNETKFIIPHQEDFKEHINQNHELQYDFTCE